MKTYKDQKKKKALRLLTCYEHLSMRLVLLLAGSTQLWLSMEAERRR